LPCGCSDERGAKGDFRLAETDVAADYTIHGFPRSQVGE
jgi:hypothetical protein